MTVPEDARTRLHQAAEIVAPMVERMEVATGLQLAEVARHDPVLAQLGWDCVQLLAVIDESAEQAAGLSRRQGYSVEALHYQGLCRRTNACLGEVAAAIESRLSALSIGLVTVGRAADRGPDSGPGKRPDRT
ncbi:hypothetical protein FB561_5753 [Kribbella amoyensis]|uniref:Uncharacterized protein n=1 Tax=Kribbella amoyensis TaxID=996641 RepID=A0A561C0C9_9ACTN|nr:hypothetical protein [Kribbella amoyensis]TWD84560.1 hypothetical protein FB561_5753 [Kribbella amoyensis]